MRKKIQDKDESGAMEPQPANSDNSKDATENSSELQPREESPAAGSEPAGQPAN
jgi:hypothetical protein